MARFVEGPSLEFASREIVKSDEWNGIGKGDTVSVSDERFVGGKYEFIAFCTNVRSGKQWIDLWGGGNNRQQLVSVRPEFVTLKVDKRRKL